MSLQFRYRCATCGKENNCIKSLNNKVLTAYEPIVLEAKCSRCGWYNDINISILGDANND